MKAQNQKRRPAQRVQVKQNIVLSPNMRRIILTAENMEGFTSQSAGAHLKLIIPQNKDAQEKLAHFTDYRDQFTVRTYTVRLCDPVKKELTIDFALHASNPGPASQWAINAKVGDNIGVAGPGPIKMNIDYGDWYLFCADMTALPAASAILEQLPSHAKGYAIFEITSEEDQQALNIPSGINIRWLVHAKPEHISSAQLDCLKNLPWLAGTPNIFVAGEGNLVRQLRSYLADEKQVSKRDMYTSPYWKIGLSEDQHQMVKRQEND